MGSKKERLERRAAFRDAASVDAALTRIGFHEMAAAKKGREDINPDTPVSARLYLEKDDPGTRRPIFYNRPPDPLKTVILNDSGECLTAMDKLGSDSTTEHAEPQAIINAKGATLYASMDVTDCPCPNCTKFQAYAGIKTLRFQHGEWGERRAGSYKNITLPILQASGMQVKVFDGFNKSKFPVPISHAFNGIEDKLFSIRPLNVHENVDLEIESRNIASGSQLKYTGITDITGAAAVVWGKDGRRYLAAAATDLPPGVTVHDYKDWGWAYEQKAAEHEGYAKYTFFAGASTVLLGGLKRLGFNVTNKTMDVHLHYVDGNAAIRPILNFLTAMPKSLSVSEGEKGDIAKARAYGVEHHGFIPYEHGKNSHKRDIKKFTPVAALRLIERACQSAHIDFSFSPPTDNFVNCSAVMTVPHAKPE